ncbi:hypothetical protein IWX90DRAFT_19749 [Phyllosticta citrichinensis]|uniref:Uncharacterized protein n=1 Tax=Phyllosticta citrichinensis TaxID=1130410 RepID=A0ABR1Y6F2_9PEZI
MYGQLNWTTRTRIKKTDRQSTSSKFRQDPRPFKKNQVTRQPHSTTSDDNNIIVTNTNTTGRLHQPSPSHATPTYPSATPLTWCTTLPSNFPKIGAGNMTERSNTLRDRTTQRPAAAITLPIRRTHVLRVIMARIRHRSERPRRGARRGGSGFAPLAWRGRWGRRNAPYLPTYLHVDWCARAPWGVARWWRSDWLPSGDTCVVAPLIVAGGKMLV